DGRAPRLLRGESGGRYLRHGPGIEGRIGAHAVSVRRHHVRVGAGAVVRARVHRWSLGSVRLQGDDRGQHRDQDPGVPVDGAVLELLRLHGRRDRARVWNRCHKTGYPGYVGQLDEAREQLDGLGYLLPDGKYWWVPRTASGG